MNRAVITPTFEIASIRANGIRAAWDLTEFDAEDQRRWKKMIEVMGRACSNAYLLSLAETAMTFAPNMRGAGGGQASVDLHAVDGLSRKNLRGLDGQPISRRVVNLGMHARAKIHIHLYIDAPIDYFALEYLQLVPEPGADRL